MDVWLTSSHSHEERNPPVLWESRVLSLFMVVGGRLVYINSFKQSLMGVLPV